MLNNQDLSRCNTFGLPCVAQTLFRFEQVSQLSALSAAIKEYAQHRVLGGGSNVIMHPDLPGLTIQVANKGIRLLCEHDNFWLVEAGAGEVWHDFVAYTLEQGWYGLENLALIPGTVGAAPVQNIGAYGLELEQRVHSVLAWNLLEGALYEFSAEECEFSYRDSMFKRAQPGTWLIVAVRFRLPRQWQPLLQYPDLRDHVSLQAAPTAQAVFDAVCEVRRTKLPDPAKVGNAGSFFKNPVVQAKQYAVLRTQHPNVVAYAQADGRYKLAAGWLIDQAGWKGREAGAVAMHPRQALVMTNCGGAVLEDVLNLAQQIQSDVQQKFGVQLEQEPVLYA
ncbi:UDP-N-acetylmuramate dehydrogenase [Alcaligenaceae bacterium 429]|nr:UDP-N-acetylmuramate dehydrogenase [Alcaligenaceae bacterium 429]